ncbi:MAG TPA: helix-turn-helix transcriptional regulator [Gemmataceae bacterium]|nr:helix-turn-helix transcriptional regulator [Gemmataceae bacterium]
MTKNWDRAAMRFASARYVDRQGMLDATFKNGDHFLAAVESILPAAGRAADGSTTLTPPEWRKLRIGETGDVLEVPAGAAVLEIPWDRIRSVADPEFRAHLADRAAERARRIGGRIRAMRLEAGLTPAALAEMVGVPREVVAGLEAGKVEPRSELMEQVAVALGRRLRDFVEEWSGITR